MKIDFRGRPFGHGAALTAALAVAAACAPVARAGHEAVSAVFDAQPAIAAQRGRAGGVVRVTNLDADGAGSLKAAIDAHGARTVVFEAGGVIDLAGHALDIRNPDITIAGQTAPSPGITLIRGGIDVRTHDVVIQHLRVRTGEAGFGKHSGWERDGLSTLDGAANVIVDHCSFAWATDENLSASGKRFTGATPDDWRAATSHDIVYSNNIIAEGLANSTHAKPGEHSKGTLVHDNVTGILLIGNLYAHNGQRNALFKGGARGAFVNNLIFDPGKRAVHYNLWATEWGQHPFQTGRLSIVGNVLRGGRSTDTGIALFMLGGEGDIELYEHDNMATDRDGRPLPMLGRYKEASGRIIASDRAAPMTPAVTLLPAAAVTDAVLAHAGARPWERDAVDRRIVADVRSGTGHIIDSEAEVGGYPPIAAATRRVFVESEWDLTTMRPLAAAH